MTEQSLNYGSVCRSLASFVEAYLVACWGGSKIEKSGKKGNGESKKKVFQEIGSLRKLASMLYRTKRRFCGFFCSCYICF